MVARVKVPLSDLFHVRPDIIFGIHGPGKGEEAAAFLLILPFRSFLDGPVRKGSHMQLETRILRLKEKNTRPGMQPLHARAVTNQNNLFPMKNSLYIFMAMLFSSTLLTAQNREVRNVENFNKISFGFPGKLYLKQGSPQKVELEGDGDVLEEVETEVDGGRLRIGKEGKWFDWNNNDHRITVYITVPNIEGVSVSGSGDIIGQTKIRTNDIDLAVSGSGSMSLDVEASGDVEANVSGSGDMDLRGHFESFESDVSGSGKVMLTAQIDHTADFGISGSGKIEASGSADMVKTRISGSGKVLAANLETNSCDVRISGSGDVEINVKNELDANISGSGSVSYKGSPKRINSHASGSGKVRKI
jgi:hypothetical protein